MRGLLIGAALLFAVAGCQRHTNESAERDAGGQPKVHAATPLEAFDAGAPMVAEAPEEQDAGLTMDAGAAQAMAEAHVYVVRDNKMRCIAAPCMSLDVMPVNSSEPTQKASDLDLSALNLAPDGVAAVTAAVHSKLGIRVEGEVVDGPRGKAGVARVVRVTKLLGTK